jgi:hypothetical protein
MASIDARNDVPQRGNDERVVHIHSHCGRTGSERITHVQSSHPLRRGGSASHVFQQGQRVAVADRKGRNGRDEFIGGVAADGGVALDKRRVSLAT